MGTPTTYEYDVFISYNQNDESWAKQLATRLEQEPWQGRKLKVFFAPWDIKPGESIVERLEYALPRSRKVSLVMSPDSTDSDWVRIERYITHHIDISERQTRLIPLYLSTCEIPPFLTHINRIDFRDEAKSEEGYRILISTLKDEPLPRGQQESKTKPTSRGPHLDIPDILRVSFVPRKDREGNDLVERLKRELAPHKNQLIALWGAGGVGKTAIAAEVARGLVDIYEHRVIWVSAEGREDFSLSTLLDAIATQTGNDEIRKLALETKKEQAREILVGAPTLVVFDNFETITPQAGRSCAEWLAQPSLCSALITTRENIRAAHRNIATDHMLPEEAEILLDRSVAEAHDKNAFANLDRERVIAASKANPLVLQWIVRQIDLAQDANEVLNDLKRGEGSAAERVFDRSFELEQLDNGGRVVLLALSLFVPGATRKALAEVAGLSKQKDKKRFKEAIKTLSSLWLLRTAEAGERLTVEGLTRELTSACLVRDPRAKTLRERYLRRFCSYIETHSRPVARDYDALEGEKYNLFNALDIAAENNKSKDLIRIMSKMGAANGMLVVRGYWDEAIRRGMQAFEAAKALNDSWHVGFFSDSLSSMYMVRGNYELAKQYCELAINMARKLDGKQELAASLHQSGILAHHQGDWEEARRLYDESLEIKRKLGNLLGVSKTLHQLAMLAVDNEDLPEARRLYDESLEIDKKLGHEEGMGNALQGLGKLAELQGDLLEARRLFEASLEISGKLGDQRRIGSISYSLGRLAEKASNKAEAARLFGEALVIFERLKSPSADIARRSLARVEGKLS
ncbi:MAG: hypothetical protein QOE77_82 [Blastocatellia bacterium]|jgi:tetratricopeptide (TPR) repeat protein|nr:hypothetical protein [Blastocatellia bacterium]